MKNKIKFLKFLFFGGLTYFINMGVTYFFVDIFFIQKEISYLLAVFLVGGINFVLSLKYTFKTNYQNQIFYKYVFFLVLFTILNYLFTNILTNFFGQKYLYIVIFCVTTFFFFLKFVIYDKFVFKKKSCKIKKII